MRRRILLLGALVAVLFIFLAGALIYEQANNGRKLGILDLYERIEIGMSRERVEAILGPPIFANDDPPSGSVQAHYLDHEYAERSLLPHESPFLGVGITVTYQNGNLVEKSYNPQWVIERPRPWWRFWS